MIVSDTAGQLCSLLVLSLKIKLTEKQVPQYYQGLNVQCLLKLVSANPNFSGRLMQQASPAVRNLSHIGH